VRELVQEETGHVRELVQEETGNDAVWAARPEHDPGSHRTWPKEEPAEPVEVK